MDVKILAIVFTTIFIAELSDKTQLATLLFAADKHASKVAVFVDASLALIIASAIGVLAGGTISHYVSQNHLQYTTGFGFMVIGLWTLFKA